MATRDVLLRYRRTSQPAPGGGTLRLPTGGRQESRSGRTARGDSQRESPKGNHAPGKVVPACQELVESALAVDAWPVADQSMVIFGPVVLSQTFSQTPAVWELGPVLFAARHGRKTRPAMMAKLGEYRALSTDLVESALSVHSC